MIRAFLALLFAGLAFGQDRVLLEWFNNTAQRQLAARTAEIEAIRDPAAAQERQQRVRAKLLELIGGLPDYKGPLNARITGTVDQGGFIIENVIFESLPRVYVTANVYRPKAPGRYPAVLIPMGHWDEGKVAAQLIASNLALKGFVAMPYDPLGQGERQQAYSPHMKRSLIGGSTEQHFMAGAQAILVGQTFARYRIWDGMRAIDYLTSRSDVDGDRIGCTGCSGGGTLTTYISALDRRVKVAAPACYMNSFRTLFTGPVGDSEQSLPGFLASGLDQTDYVELFAPKPWLIASTEGDFFTPEGARQVYDEAKSWYKLFKADERVKWVVGPGGHGTPLLVREAIYEWMIRWLKEGSGDAREQPVELVPDYRLVVTERGQVQGRDIYEVIRETRRHVGSREELAHELKHLMSGPLPPARITMLPETAGTTRRPGVVFVSTTSQPPAAARKLADEGNVVAVVLPSGLPFASTRQFSGAWMANTHAWLIGRNLPGMRAAEILRGVDSLASRPDVDTSKISGVAREIPGIWLLLAAAADPRLTGLTLEKTPYSLRAGLDTPVQQNLHDAVIPGFALRWDLADLVSAMTPRKVRWINPTDWNRNVVKVPGTYEYRAMEP